VWVSRWLSAGAYLVCTCVSVDIPVLHFWRGVAGGRECGEVFWRAADTPYKANDGHLCCCGARVSLNGNESTFLDVGPLTALIITR
jgi:hypothetical protein